MFPKIIYPNKTGLGKNNITNVMDIAKIPGLIWKLSGNFHIP